MLLKLGWDVSGEIAPQYVDIYKDAENTKPGTESITKYTNLSVSKYFHTADLIVSTCCSHLLI